MFKEESRSVGRPKLADTNLKKRSLLIATLCIILAMVVLFTGAYKLNIIKFGKLKGTVTCEGIPDKFRPYDEETNPNGIDHGFTDPAFYSLVISQLPNASSSYCDNDTTITLNNFESIAALNISDTNINDVNGIENLTNLTQLEISNNNIEAVDLYYNLRLRRIYITASNLSSLRLPMVVGQEVTINRHLEELEIYNTKIESIDLYNHLSLDYLRIGNNSELKTLNLSRNGELNSLFVYNTPITNLVLPNVNNNKLREIIINNLPLTSLDLTNNKKLDFISIQNTNITLLDLRQIEYNPDDSVHVTLQKNKLQQIFFPTTINIEWLDIRDNELTSLNVSGLINMLDLYADNNNLINITGISSASKLNSVSLNNNKLTYLDLSLNGQLSEISAENNKLNTILLPNSVVKAYLNQNNLSSIDLNGLSELAEIVLSDNDLTSIDVKTNTKLQSIIASNNKLTKMNFNNNPNVFLIMADHNEISQIEGLEDLNTLLLLIVSNNKLKTLDLTNNSGLMVIGVTNNLFEDTLYFEKSQEENLYTNVLLNGMTATIDDENIVGYEDDKFVVKNTGETNVSFSDSRFIDIDPESETLSHESYTLDYRVVVYELVSNSNCVINKDGKTIDAKGLALDEIDIDVNYEGLEGTVEGNKYIIKDGEKVVKTYSIVNYKDEEPEDDTDNQKESSKKKASFDIKDAANNVKNTMESIFIINRATNKVTTTKPVATTKANNNMSNFITGNNKVITPKDNSNIMIILLGIQMGLLLAIVILLYYKRKKAN